MIPIEEMADYATSGLSERLKEKAYGHPELWECSVEEFIEKVIPVMQAHQKRNKLQPKVIKTAAGFLRIRFDANELKGTIEYEVSTAIEQSLIYYVNCLGEEVKICQGDG